MAYSESANSGRLVTYQLDRLTAVVQTRGSDMSRSSTLSVTQSNDSAVAYDWADTHPGRNWDEAGRNWDSYELVAA